MKKLWVLGPLVVFLALVAFLFRGLFSDPTEIQSALIGKPVPTFEMVDLFETQKRHNGELLKTGEPVLLNVWATWCPTCYAEHQYLNELARKGVRIVGLNYKDERDGAIRWLSRLGNPYEVTLYDPDGMLGLDLGVYGAPETYLIDGQGIIRYRHVGDVNERIWRQVLGPKYEELRQ